MPVETDQRRTQTGHIPGEPGIWVMILGDLFVFALLFGTVAYYRMLEPAVFHTSQEAVNQALGLTNTIALLTSSLFVAKGLAAARSGRTAAATLWIRCATALGALFVVIKLIEYAQKGAEGFYPDTNMFFTLYFVLTGMHLVHVLLGLVALLIMAVQVRAASAGGNLKLAECCALFWHMVDVLWVILFAIFYLHR